MADVVLFQGQAQLGGVNHRAPACVHDPVLNGGEVQVIPLQERFHGLADVAAHDMGDIAHGRPLLGDAEALEVEGDHRSPFPRCGRMRNRIRLDPLRPWHMVISNHAQVFLDRVLEHKPKEQVTTAARARTGLAIMCSAEGAHEFSGDYW